MSDGITAGSRAALRASIPASVFVFRSIPMHWKKPVCCGITSKGQTSVIDATLTDGMTFLETAFGKPFTSNGFGNRFKKWCQEAGPPDRCSVHGLRKAGATRLANSGASDHDIMAVTGHTTVKQLHGYTREADRKVGAERALKKL